MRNVSEHVFTEYFWVSASEKTVYILGTSSCGFTYLFYLFIYARIIVPWFIQLIIDSNLHSLIFMFSALVIILRYNKIIVISPKERDNVMN